MNAIKNKHRSNLRQEYLSSLTFIKLMDDFERILILKRPLVDGTSKQKFKDTDNINLWFDNTLKSNTIRCKKLTTIVSGQKNAARPFVRWKQVSRSAVRLMKGHAMFFRPETSVASFLHLMVLFFKVLLNHTSKCRFLVLHCH